MHMGLEERKEGIVPKNINDLVAKGQGSDLQRHRLVNNIPIIQYIQNLPHHFRVLLIKYQIFIVLSKLGETPEDAMSRAYREEFARIMGANNKGFLQHHHHYHHRHHLCHHHHCHHRNHAQNNYHTKT